MKLKIISLIKKIPKSVFLGLADAILPNIKESIKENPSEFVQLPSSFKIDWTRLTSAFVFFTLILLAIFDFITFNDIVKFFKEWSLLLQ
jgi:hypothetical protein